jgi:transcriptional regulator with XRE-family HTH domain
MIQVMISVWGYEKKSLSLRINQFLELMTKAVNRLKVVLVERKKTGKWLAEQLGKDPSTVSKWCSNTTQPQLDILVSIAKLLDVDIKELINEKDLN